MATAIFDNLTADTREAILKELTDQIFENNPLWRRMKADGRMKEPRGGLRCEFRANYAKTTAAGNFMGHTILETAPNQKRVRPNLDWGGFYTSMSEAVTESAINSGEEQIADFLQSEIDNAQETLDDNIGTGLFSDGTDTNGIVGLKQAVCSSAEAAGEGVSATYANIPRGTYSWFDANVIKDTTEYTVANLRSSGATEAKQLMYLLKRLYGMCTTSKKGGAPTVHITSQSFYDLYEEWALSLGQIGMVSGINRAKDNHTDLGFQSFTFKGAPIIIDSHCPTNYWYMLNERRLFWQPLGNANVQMSEWTKPTNQLVKVAQIYLLGQLLLTEPRTCGVLIGDSTTLDV